MANFTSSEADDTIIISCDILYKPDKNGKLQYGGLEATVMDNIGNMYAINITEDEFVGSNISRKEFDVGIIRFLHSHLQANVTKQTRGHSRSEWSEHRINCPQVVGAKLSDKSATFDPDDNDPR